MNFLFKPSSAPLPQPRRASSPTAPPMEYLVDGDDLPIAVAVAIPPPSTPTATRDEAIPPTSAAAPNVIITIDRSSNVLRDGSLSLTINTTTHYPNGHRERKIEYYRIPRNMVRKVSAALDNGNNMPNTSYLVRMEQQSLPPGTTDLPMHPPPPTTTTTAGTILQQHGYTGVVGMQQHHHHHLGSNGRKCGICWCTTCTLCIGTTLVIGIILVALFVVKPWSKVVHSWSHMDDNGSNNNDGSVGEWMTLYPSVSPP